MIYKKGSIIPRRLIRCTNRKTQHLWTFGADVDVTQRVITVLSEGPAIVSRKGFIGGKKGKPKIINNASMKLVFINNSTSTDPIFDVTYGGDYISVKDVKIELVATTPSLNDISAEDLKWNFRGDEK